MADSRKEIKKELHNLIVEGVNFFDGETEELKNNTISSINYQRWYTKSLAVIKQLIPDRLDEFKELYKVEKRKEMTITTYGISDFLQGIAVTRGPYKEEVFNSQNVAGTKLEQQIAIVESAKTRIDSILSDIEGLLKADLFDDEISASESLLKSKHLRSAGTVAGVVLESHLSDVCKNHGIKTRKKNPAISDYNDLLKTEKVLDTPNWRKIQRLGDIRNYCTHKKERDPTPDEVEELIEGVKKTIKTLF
jgi:hypothetical protein